MQKRASKILGFVVLVAIIAVPTIVLKQLGLGKEEIQIFVEQLLERLGIWAPIGLFLLRFSSVVIPALPGTLYSVLAGSFFGFWYGIALVCFSDLCSCSLSFWLASRFGRSFVSKLIGERSMMRVERFSQKNLENNVFLISALMMTSFFDFVAYAAGLAKAPWKKFLPALIISVVVSNPPFVAFGAGVLFGSRATAGIALGSIFLLTLITGLIKQRTGIAKV